MSIDKRIDLEEQYDKIYRYCYFKVNQRETAEDITQETFLRFLESENYQDRGEALRYLYTIARNLCIDEYRKKKTEILSETVIAKEMEDTLLTNIMVKTVLEELPSDERELLLLRYINEVPVSVICRLFDISRFTLYRRINKILKKIKERFREEDLYG